MSEEITVVKYYADKPRRHVSKVSVVVGGKEVVLCDDRGMEFVSEVESVTGTAVRTAKAVAGAMGYGVKELSAQTGAAAQGDSQINTLDETEPGIAPVGPNMITFTVHDGETEILRFADNGDVYYRGKVIENDKDIVRGIREFLSNAGCL